MGFTRSLVTTVPSILLVTLIIAIMAARGTVITAYMTVLIPSAIQDTALGIIQTVAFMTGALSPVLFGFMTDQGYFDEAFLVLAGLSGVSMIAIYLLPPVGEY